MGTWSINPEKDQSLPPIFGNHPENESVPTRMPCRTSPRRDTSCSAVTTASTTVTVVLVWFKLGSDMFRQQTVYICEHESWIVLTQGAQAVRYQYEVNEKSRPLSNSLWVKLLINTSRWRCITLGNVSFLCFMSRMHCSNLCIGKISQCRFTLAFRMFPIVPIPEMNRRAMNSLWMSMLVGGFKSSEKS